MSTGGIVLEGNIQRLRMAKTDDGRRTAVKTVTHAEIPSHGLFVPRCCVLVKQEGI